MFQGLLKSLFDVDNVKSAFRTAFEKREDNFRTYIILIGNTLKVIININSDLGVSFLIEIFLITGKGPTMYLYFRKQFSWNERGFGMYIGIFGIMGITAQYVIIPFMSNRLKLGDMTIGTQLNTTHDFDSYWLLLLALIAISGVVIQHLIVCFTPPDMIYLVYIGSTFSILSVCITTVCRSLITKCVKPWEVGKVFSVIGAIQV